MTIKMTNSHRLWPSLHRNHSVIFLFFVHCILSSLVPFASDTLFDVYMCGVCALYLYTMIFPDYEKKCVWRRWSQVGLGELAAAHQGTFFSIHILGYVHSCIICTCHELLLYGTLWRGLYCVHACAVQYIISIVHGVAQRYLHHNANISTTLAAPTCVCT